LSTQIIHDDTNLRTSNTQDFGFDQEDEGDNQILLDGEEIEPLDNRGTNSGLTSSNDVPGFDNYEQSRLDSMVSIVSNS